MSDPSLPLQGAIVAALKASAPLQALLSTRVYDEPPSLPTFPYISYGEGHVVGDDTEDCGDGSEVFVQLHAWSRAVGFPEVKMIAEGIRGALKAPPALSGFQVSVVEYVQTQFLRDPDGKTRHAMVEFRYLINHTS